MSDRDVVQFAQLADAIVVGQAILVRRLQGSLVGTALAAALTTDQLERFVADASAEIVAACAATFEVQSS